MSNTITFTAIRTTPKASGLRQADMDAAIVKMFQVLFVDPTWKTFKVGDVGYRFDFACRGVEYTIGLTKTEYGYLCVLGLTEEVIEE